MDFIFATNNQHKILEVSKIMPNWINIKTLKDVGITEDIPEPFSTFQENAWSKAHYVFEKTGKNCWAEDSGLVVPVLNGAPGVHSARYAGIGHNDELNNEKLLKNIIDKQDISAYYQAFICLIQNKKTYYFEGKCEGFLLKEYRGTNGFGYDPLFVPNGYQQTFGELSSEIKNKISHRAKAFQKLATFLKVHSPR